MKSISLVLIAALCSASAADAGSLHTRVYRGNTTFTVPNLASTATEFEFTVVGGGGGGGCPSSSFPSGGGAGAAGMVVFKGFNPADVITITIGTGGAGGNSSNASGQPGTGTYLVWNGLTIAEADGGGGGSVAGSPGAGGAFSTPLYTGLTRNAYLDYVAENGTDIAYPISLAGGGNSVGHAGSSGSPNGVNGGGGLLCSSGGDGGHGGLGLVIVRWYS